MSGRNYKFCVGFEVFTAVLAEVLCFWIVVPCSLLGHHILLNNTSILAMDRIISEAIEINLHHIIII
jgi:hypothetical protein